MGDGGGGGAKVGRDGGSWQAGEVGEPGGALGRRFSRSTTGTGPRPEVGGVSARRVHRPDPPARRAVKRATAPAEGRA